MNLLQLKENFESTLLRGDSAKTVKKAVAYCNGCQTARKYDTAIICLNKLLINVEKDTTLRAVVLLSLIHI